MFEGDAVVRGLQQPAGCRRHPPRRGTARLERQNAGCCRLPRGNQLLVPRVINQGLQIFTAFNIGSFRPFNQVAGNPVALHINNATQPIPFVAFSG